MKRPRKACDKACRESHLCLLREVYGIEAKRFNVTDELSLARPT